MIFYSEAKVYFFDHCNKTVFLTCALQKHDIPASAIPCYQYRKALEKEHSTKSVGDGANDVSSTKDSPVCASHNGKHRVT